jgi:hypothetical protein
MEVTQIDRRQLFTRAGAVGLGALAAMGPTTVLANEDERKGPAGTWHITIVSEGPGAPPPVEGISSFGSNGVFANVDALGVGSSLGSWKQKNGNGFGVTFVSFNFDPSGNNTGKTKARATGTVNGDSIAGRFAFDVFDPAGHVVFSGAGSFSGTRLVVEAL